MIKYEKMLAEVIKERAGLTEVILEIPPNDKLGDLALPCFSMAKEFRKSPMKIAEDIKIKLGTLDFIARMEIAGGYLNFYLNKAFLTKDTLTTIQQQKDFYGASGSGKGKKALVEHTSINPNASPHVGRARNAMIGDVIVRMLKFESYDVDTHYFVNDIGKQIAMLLLGAQNKTDIVFKDLLDIYVDINKKVEENPELEKEVFELLYKLENGDQEVKEAFRSIVDICIKGQTKIFSELGVFYDTFKYESDYIWSDRTKEILQLLKATGKLKEDEEGRLVLNQEEYNLPMKAPYLVLTRKDKTTLYPTRDIAYTIDKVKSADEKNIVVLGEDQKLYFQQVKAALDLMGYSAPTPVHYSFVLLAEGKMATRKGNVVLLEDFMKEALDKASKGLESRQDTYDEEIAKAIAYGAVKYAFLKVANDKNVTFDWESALSFEGDSGPYLQYSYARINSIFKKFNDNLPQEVDFSLLKENVEYELVKDLANFPKVINRALEELSPHIITTYIYALTKKFSRFYHECSIVNAENTDIRDVRLVLIHCIKQVIKNCFDLLGIEAVDTM
jgi:arginyl-tRNA synthetase